MASSLSAHQSFAISSEKPRESPTGGWENRHEGGGLAFREGGCGQGWAGRGKRFWKPLRLGKG